jgi:protein-tyrosine-phosphatase
MLAQVAQDAAEGLTWSQVLTAATQVVIILGALAAGYASLRKWVRDTAGTAEVRAEVAAQAATTAAQQLATSNGRTVGQYVESSAAKLDELAGMARDNRTLIVETRRELAETRRDLAEHVIKGH